MSDENYFLTLNSLMRYLAMRDHSVKELREKLRRKFTAQEVDRAIETAHANGWLIPPQELSEKVAGQLGRKGKGRIYINRYLSLKGLPIVSWDDDLELSKGKEIVSSKLGFEPPFTPEQKKKVFRYLTNRGFEASTARKVCYEER
jgi:SOS response regulatory protein OraA/RecX